MAWDPRLTAATSKTMTSHESDATGHGASSTNKASIRSLRPCLVVKAKGRSPPDNKDLQGLKEVNKYECFPFQGISYKPYLSTINGKLIHTKHHANSYGRAHSNFISLLSSILSMLPVVYTVVFNQSRSLILILIFALSLFSNLAHQAAAYGQLILYALVIVQQVEFILGTIQTSPGGKRIAVKQKKRVTWFDGRKY